MLVLPPGSCIVLRDEAETFLLGRQSKSTSSSMIEREREREKAVACWLLLLFILWQTDNKKRKKKKKEEELLRARELNKQSLIFQGILYDDNGAGRDALSCYNTARFRGCHGGIISPRCWPALRDATLLSLLLIFNGHLMMIFEVFAGSSRGIV